MNDVRPLFDPGFTERLPQITAALAPAVSDLPPGGRHWVFYGSRPLGLARQGSDLNALLLLDDFRGAPHRRDGRWATVPVTIHVLSRDQFTADGHERRYGGYFALKLLAPFMSSRASDDELLSRTTAGFLGPFAEAVADRWYRPAWSADQLLAHAYLAFLDLHPDATSYLARLRRHADLFGRAWRHQREVYVAALGAAGMVAPHGGNRWHYTDQAALDDAPREHARATARFWAAGTTCHDFPDEYFTKSDVYASRAEQTATRQALLDMVTGEGRVVEPVAGHRA
ncbi:hypothetical protein [Saccharothrix sp. ALI-22-I]|uniref:hypothetical protein n=1 Tax=Saccharothrix sp. ALI-22-I TaxID=1933778 RepID=UPI00117A9B68|nr:hypothetical protein [Saccharothrix sp. ALI-22-I]